MVLEVTLWQIKEWKVAKSYKIMPGPKKTPGELIRVKGFKVHLKTCLRPDLVFGVWRFKNKIFQIICFVIFVDLRKLLMQNLILSIQSKLKICSFDISKIITCISVSF